MTPRHIGPTKAYLVRWTIANEMEALIYANSAREAVERVQVGEANAENTYNDRRISQPHSRRFPQEDLR